MKKALITGFPVRTEPVGELIMEKGYEVLGVKRRSSSFKTARIDHMYQDPYEKKAKFFLPYGDLADSGNLIRIVQEVKPDEVYNLGACPV